MGIPVSRWILTLLLLCPLMSVASPHPIKVVVYADDSYPPYSYSVIGEPKGIYTEILKLIFSKMTSYEVTIQPIPWKRGLKLLEQGKGFALYPPYYYADRRDYISPYSSPILPEEVVVFCHPDSISDRQLNEWPNDFFGLTIGINEAFALGGDAFWQAVNKKKLFILSAKGNQTALINLYKRRSDCYINDKLSILWDVQRLKKEGLLPLDWNFTLSATVSSEYGHLGFTKLHPERYPYKDDFVLEFNAHLEQLQREGTVEQLMSRYFTPNQ